MCAAMVSARRPASSMLDSEVSTSGGTFLLSLTYWSNRAIAERMSTSCSRSSDSRDSSRGSMTAEKDSSVVRKRSIRAR